jgi:Tfp pilus assembly protein PilO
MFRLAVPAILIVIAAALFIVYIDPQYQKIKTLRAEEATYDGALTKSRELQEERNKLISKRNTFSPESLRKLERLLPDNVDNIRLIIDIDTIAARYGLRVRNVAVNNPQTSREAPNAGAVGDSGDGVGSVELSFVVTAQYEDFLRFLKDLERSVRIVDINSISFGVGEGDLIQYSVAVRTYWLR